MLVRAALERFPGAAEDPDLGLAEITRPGDGQGAVPLGDDGVAKLLVVECAGGPEGVLEDRLPEAGALGQFDVAPDRRVIHASARPSCAGVTLGFEEVFEVGDDFLGVRGLGVVHAEDNTGDAEAGVDLFADEAHGFEQFAHTLEGEEVGLHGDDDFLGGGQCVEGEQAEGRGAVEEDELVVGAGALDGFGEALVASGLGGEFGLDGGEGGLGGDDVEVLIDLADAVADVDVVVEEQVVDGGVGIGRFVVFDADVERGVGLGVEVDDEDLASLLGDGRGEVDGGGGFAHAAFLVHQGDDADRFVLLGFVHYSEYIG